jgi:hypothetical protein
VIPSISANIGEVNKALTAAEQDYYQVMGKHSTTDTFWFVGDEEKLTIYWEAHAEVLNA